MILLEQVASLIVWIKKLLFLTFTFKQPVGWRFSFNPTQRNSACWNTKIFREGLFRNPCSYITAWIDYLTGGSNPFCIFNKNRVSLYARAGVLSSQSFSLPSFYFDFSKNKQNTHYNFFFTLSRFPRYPWTAGWFGGNDCCAISTARLQNESAFVCSPVSIYVLPMWP